MRIDLSEDVDTTDEGGTTETVSEFGLTQDALDVRRLDFVLVKRSGETVLSGAVSAATVPFEGC